jgi:Leucine-rich repeat (LRR) protein
VFEDGRHVCATFEDFLECPEYFQRYNLTAPANPKKRWLSSSSECDWYGVFCNADGDVEQLTLANNGLEGELIPELDMLTELYLLNLGENNLVGSLPEWEGLTQLEFVSLYDNMLEGIIPWRAWKKLETLDLAKNNFTGALILPEKWIGLKTLILSDNRLDLTLRPRVGLWTELEILDLSGNTLAGELPGTMGNWKRLRSLNLANCQVTGHIPPGIVALSNLGKFLKSWICCIVVPGNTLLMSEFCLSCFFFCCSRAATTI